MNIYHDLKNSINNLVSEDQSIIVDLEKMKTIKNDCLILETIADENDCEDASVEINRSRNECAISITVPILEFENGGDHPFFQMIQHIKELEFQNKNNRVVMTVIYGGIFHE